MGFSVTHLVVVLVIVVVLFGTGKLRSMGSDLGAAVKGFKKAISDDDANQKPKALAEDDKKPDDHTPPTA